MTPIEIYHHCKTRLPEDPRAFEILVAHYKHLVFRTAYRLMRNREDAEDQAQEVFIKIYRGLGNLQDPATLNSWVYQVTVNTCLDALRRNKRQGRVEPLFVTNADGQESEDIHPDERQPNPEEAALEKEFRFCLEEALSAVNENGRVTLILREIEERPYEEIAQTLGLGLSAVKMRIHRARLSFQQILERICPDIWKAALPKLKHGKA